MAHRVRVPSKLPQLQGRGVQPRLTLPPHQSSTIKHTIRAQQLPFRLSSTAISHRQEIAPARQTSGLGSLPLTWPHKGWDDKVVLEVVPSHREPRTLSDKIAWRVIRLCRYVRASSPPPPLFFHVPRANTSADGGWTLSLACLQSQSLAARAPARLLTSP
jgi:hypothetical protein